PRQNVLPRDDEEVFASKSTVLELEENPPVMMIHPSKDPAPWVSSANWDGGNPEADRSFELVFPGLSVAIKYQGTTVADIGSKFLRYNYIVLAALSVLMAGGIWLTYRNVSRELTLGEGKPVFS